MSADDDIRTGMAAVLSVNADAVRRAVARAAGVLGGHAETTETGSHQVVVRIRPGYGRLSAVSPVVTVSLKEVAGKLQVTAQITSYVQTQAKMFGFIGMGPKSLVGKDAYYKWLDALSAELTSLDPAGEVRRVTSGG